MGRGITLTQTQWDGALALAEKFDASFVDVVTGDSAVHAALSTSSTRSILRLLMVFLPAKVCYETTSRQPHGNQYALSSDVRLGGASSHVT